MADEGEQVETTTTTEPDSETLKGTAAPDADGTQAELERLRAALKKANNEAASRRKKVEAFEKAEEERKQAEMTELEQAQAALAAMTGKLEAAQQEKQTQTVRHAIDGQARELGFHDPSDAWRFLGADAVTLTDEGQVEGAEAALKALAKERPYLVKSGQPTLPDIDGAKRTTAKNRTPDNAAIAGKYGIRVYD